MAGPWEKYASPQAVSGPWTRYAPQPEPEETASQRFADHPEQILMGAGIGALKGAGSTAEHIGHALFPDWAARAVGMTPPTPEQEAAPFQPKGGAQKFGKTLEQVGEFLLPGGAEEDAAKGLVKIAPGLGKAAEPLAHVFTSAASAGAVNAAQGGSPLTGAALSAGGATLGMAGKAAAPRLAEFAQGIHTPGAKSGRAILDETKALFPGSVRRSAQEVLNRLNPEMENLVDQASLRPSTVPIGPQLEPNPSISLLPARKVAAEGVGKAAGGTSALAPAGRNESKMAKGVQRLARIVNEDLQGNPLPENVTPRQALELRRGVDSALPKGSFNPQSTNVFKGYRTPLRDALNESIGRVVSEYRPIAQRISALIPASEPGGKGFGHLWGPGAGAIFGGYYGARAGARNEGGLTGALKGGLQGAAEGATAGTVLPAGINATARLLDSGVLPRVFAGAAAPGTRKRK